MPRWFKVTASVAVFVAMGAGVLYPRPAALSLEALLLGLRRSSSSSSPRPRRTSPRGERRKSTRSPCCGTT